jgi:SAM-dependent methyltransferase
MTLNQTSDIERILKRIGYDEVASTRNEPSPLELPDAVLSYLTASNPRLQEIRESYEALVIDALQHSQWSQDFVQREVSLGRFRDDSAYLWQHRDLNFPANYLCTYYYHALSEAQDLLAACNEDDLFGAYAIRLGSEVITRDRLDSVSQISFIRDELGLGSKSFTVLDIGSGYGRFAHRLAQCFPNSRVICTDAIPESLFLCEFYLKFRGVSDVAEVVEIPNLEQHLNRVSVDLAVAINSLSECSAVAIAWWLNLIREYKVPYLLFIPHATANTDGGRELFSRELNPYRIANVSQLLHNLGYRRIVIKPKYAEPELQRYGLTPTYYHLFALQK